MRSNDLRRRRKKPSRGKRGSYNDYKIKKRELQRALEHVKAGNSFRRASALTGVPKSTVLRVWKEMSERREDDPLDTRELIKVRQAERLVVLSNEEEKAVEEYCLWQFDRGMGLSPKQVKAIIREIHHRDVTAGEQRQAINQIIGPSNKYMRGFYNRHLQLSRRSAEQTDHQRIKMANKDTVAQYFETLKKTLIETKITDIDDDGGERIYLADETGWGADKKLRRVVGRKGSVHAYVKKPSDETHRTLMLVVCGNGEVLKSLIILEKSFPLLDEGEADALPPDTLFSKTENGSMEKQLFVDWLKHSVVVHKLKVNPEERSLLILDNHGSRFSIEAIDLCIANKIEILCYPGHLTHILQGPDVLLNKPLKSHVDSMIQNHLILTGSSTINRLNFISVIENAVREICTKEMVLKAFSSTGVFPFNPEKIDLSKFPTNSSNSTSIPDSPVQATCTSCRKNNVELHPLVRQGCIPKKLADVFTYEITPKKSRTRVKSVENARVITSEEVRKEVKDAEEKKKKPVKRKSAPAKKANRKNSAKVFMCDDEEIDIVITS